MEDTCNFISFVGSISVHDKAARGTLLLNTIHSLVNCWMEEQSKLSSQFRVFFPRERSEYSFFVERFGTTAHFCRHKLFQLDSRTTMHGNVISYFFLNFVALKDNPEVRIVR